MKLPETCIKHPVFAIVLSLVLMVIGLVSYQRLELRFFPSLTQPIVYVSVYYEGASPETMENNVTTLIENAIAGIEGIEAVYSSSRTSWSSLTVLFSPGVDVQAKGNEVRNKIYGLTTLPTGINPPNVSVGGTTGSVFDIVFTDKKMPVADVRDYVERNIQPELRQIEGVGSVAIIGASDYAMRIWLDSARMSSLGVTAIDIQTALTSNNIDFPAGYVQTPARNYTIVSQTRLKTADDFANIIIKHAKGRTIRFKDVADVKLDNRSLQDAPMRINGEPGLDISVRPLRSANPIDVADKVKAALPRIRRNLPQGMTMKVSYDQSLFLKSAINDTFMAIIEAVILVILIIFLFLGSFRAAAIPIVTIPVCMISVFSIMLLFGFSINTLSLLAIVLAIGLVVDDAIVMVENIHRHIEEGLPPLKAALVGSKEIALPIVAMSLTLTAVYAPIGFARGITAEIFKEFAFTLAGAVVISGFVALSLSPMMGSKLLKLHTGDSFLVNLIDKFFNRLSSGYRKILRKILRKKLLIVFVLAIIAVFGWAIFKTTPSEFIPKEDTGQIIGSITSPAGANVDYTNKYNKQVEKIFSEVPEAETYYSMVSGGSATTYMTLKPWVKRTRTADQIVAELSPKLTAITGVDASVSVPDVVQYGIGGHDISFNIMTTGDYNSLLEPADQMVQALRQYPGLQRVNTTLKYDSQQYAITINRDLAGVLGINIQNIATTVQTMMGGFHLTDVQAGSRSYPVMLQMQKSDLKNFRGFKKLYVRNADGNMIPLSSLVTLTPIVGQSSRTHFNRMRSANVYGDLALGYTESQAINYVTNTADKIIPAQFRYEFDGKARDFLESKGGVASIFVLSFIFIFLVLSAQFGSFIDPFIILLSVPLSIVGALFSLKMGKGTINVYSQIGFVTLIGMISKHGILITQFTNNLRADGTELYDAIVKAASIRLRPILMTTCAMIFGSLPLAFATGPGSIGRSQIGWVIVGGLLFGTFFSLIVVPIAYSFFGRLKKFTPPESQASVEEEA